MVWGIFLNNQLVSQAVLMPNGRFGTATRYIFIDGRDVPIIFKDEKSTVPQSWAVGIDDGKNPRYQIGYEGQGNLQVTIVQKSDALQYTVDSGFAKVTKDL